MTIGTVRTQGTEIFFIDTVEDSNTRLRKMACPTGLTGVGGGAKDQIEDTCLDNTTDKTFKAGLGNPVAISVPFNFIPTGPANAPDQNHRALFALKEAGDVVKWLVAFSDGTTDPTIDDDRNFIPPANRTSIEFEAYVSEVTLDIATNEIVRGTLTLQRTGPEIPHWLGPVPA